MQRPIVSKQAVLKVKGVNPYVDVTAAEAATLKNDWRKPLPVCIQVNGKPDEPWHINMVPIGDGNFYLYLHNDVRKAAHVQVGDTIDVRIWFDETYQNGPQHPIPSWFSEALDESESARIVWQALSPSRQKEVLRYFYGLQSEEAKSRNLVRMMAALSGAPTHFMGRDWKDGK